MVPTFDRSKIKATPLSVLKKQEENVTSLIGSSSNRPDYLKIVAGENTFRIFPAHPGTQSFIYEKVLHWIPQKVKVSTDGKEEVKIERRPIFNARIHGGLPKDIIEEYSRICIKKFSSIIQDEAELAKKLYPILDWKEGLKPKISWVCYAKKVINSESHFGMLDISNGTKEKLNDLSITEDADQAISTDPFTDIEEGKAIKITYTPKAKAKKDIYKVSLLWRDNWSLTDEELEKWFALEPLEKIFRNSYKRKDFERAIAGLELLDEKEDYGIFMEEEFQQVLVELDEMIGEDEVEVAEESEESDAEENQVEEVEKSEEVVEKVKEPVKEEPAKKAVPSSEEKVSGKKISLKDLKDKYKK